MKTPVQAICPLLTMILLLACASASPQARETLPFNDDWEFSFDHMQIDGAGDTGIDWEKINIPHTWNDKDIQSGEEVNFTTAWYRKEFAPKDSKGEKRYFLRFEGVGQHAALYVNGKYVGEHLGSYAAFAFDISGFLVRDAVNTIHVKVNNELNDSYPRDNFLFGIYGGIYRDVALIVTGPVHLGVTDHASSGVYVHPTAVDEEKAELTVVALVENDGPGQSKIRIQHELIGENDEVVASGNHEEPVSSGSLSRSSSLLEVDHPRLWNGRIDPFLYRLKTRLIVDGEVADEIVHPFGIRYFDIDPEKGFMLNGEPYRLHGVCRHQEWEDLGNALLPEHHRTDMALIREMGATSIRLAHYQQAELVYDLADSLGLLVWAEIPFVNGYQEGADGNARLQMTELIKQNFNHPSIFAWGVHNEVIKGDVVQEPVDLTRELHLLAKDLDPHRYTVAASNLWWVFDHPSHGITDLQGFNQYTGWYGGKPEELAKWIGNFHQAKPDVRVSISEYGAGGNIHQQSHDVETPPDPKGPVFAEGYQTHYHEQTWAAIEEAPFVWASYVWNMFDFAVPEWDRGGIKGRNHKGLVTYDRKTRKDAFYWYKANWSEERVLYLAGRRNNHWEQDAARIKAYCNFAVPELYVDGVSLGEMEKGVNDVMYVMPGVRLAPGEHRIEVRAGHQDETYTDGYEVIR